MSCRRTATNTDTPQGAYNPQDTTDTDADRYTREISYTPNFQSIFSNPHLPQPSSPLQKNSASDQNSATTFNHQNHALDLLHQPQNFQLGQLLQNCLSSSGQQPARPLSQPAAPARLQFSQASSSNVSRTGNSPSPHLLAANSPILPQQQVNSAPSCCIPQQHQTSNTQQQQQHQQLINSNNLYMQQSPALNNYTTVAAAAAVAAVAARAVRNTLYQSIDMQRSQPQQQQTHMMAGQQAARPINQQQQQQQPPTMLNYQLQQNSIYLPDQRVQSTRSIDLPNQAPSELSNALQRVAIIRATPYQAPQVQQQQPHQAHQHQQSHQPQQLQQPHQAHQQQYQQPQQQQQPPPQPQPQPQRQQQQPQQQQQPIQSVQQIQRIQPVQQIQRIQPVHQPITQPPYSHSISATNGVQPTPRTYHNFARRQRAPRPVNPNTIRQQNQQVTLVPIHTPVSVSSTTVAVNPPSKQHVATQVSPEVLNKACQFDGRNIMINKSLNAIVTVLDQVTQTEEEIKPTYVDRACSPIQIHHLQHIQPLPLERVDIPVRKKVTAKRRKVEPIIEKRKSDSIDSDTEINILE